jgi:adenylate cyclase
MFTDLVGFTALTQSDEAQSLAVLERHNRLLRSIFPKYRGREVKTIGDSFLVEFDSALDATNCAVEVQRFLHDYNISSRDEWKITLRIGIHLGDVVRSGDDILGDAVNIASRIQPLAEPEGVCISEQVYDQVRNKIPQALVKLDSHSLKGVKFAVDVFKVVMPWEKIAPLNTQADTNRVAVLPFANMSPDPNDEYFADGMTEELIDRLAQVKQLKVIARTSVMSYKGEKKKASQIARELEVAGLVEGSVRKAGNRVRVTVQLINGGTEEHLWSSHYDGSLDDIFAVQSEIAEKVATELKVQLLEPERKNLEKKPTESTEAYSAFLRGRELLREGSEPSIRQALALFEKAVELDPTFARAYVEMAECHNTLTSFGEHPDVAHPLVRASLSRALELDPGLAEAHSVMSELLNNEDDLPGAEAEARRALELNPSLPEPYRTLFEIAAMKGEPDEMVRSTEISYHLDPVRPLFIWLLGQVYLWMGEDSKALELWKKTEQISPAFTYRGLADYYLSKGDISKAREYHAKVAKLITHPWVIYAGGMIDAQAGEKDKATLAIKKLEEDAKVNPVAFNYMAYVYQSLGDLDSYFECMDKAVEGHVQIQSIMMYSPLIAKARADPRFPHLVERIRKQTGLAK